MEKLPDARLAEAWQVAYRETWRHENNHLNYEQRMSNNPAGGAPVLKGRAAPGFTLPKPEGEYLSLQDLRGKKILLVFLRHFG